MELKDLRNRIDEIDDKILSLFLERMECSEQIADYKKEHSLPILNRVRENEILEDVQKKAGDKAIYARQLFSTLMELSKACQVKHLSQQEAMAYSGKEDQPENKNE